MNCCGAMDGILISVTTYINKKIYSTKNRAVRHAKLPAISLRKLYWAQSVYSLLSSLRFICSLADQSERESMAKRESQTVARLSAFSRERFAFVT